MPTVAIADLGLDTPPTADQLVRGKRGRRPRECQDGSAMDVTRGQGTEARCDTETVMTAGEVSRSV